MKGDRNKILDHTGTRPSDQRARHPSAADFARGERSEVFYGLITSETNAFALVSIDYLQSIFKLFTGLVNMALIV